MDRAAIPMRTALNARIAKLALTPDWLSLPVRMHARHGRLADARRLIDLMTKTAGLSVADASVARNTSLDQAYLDLATAEVEMASGRPERAVALLEPASLILKEGSIESLARAYAATGKSDQAIGHYEEFVNATRVGNETQEIWQAAVIWDLAELCDRAGSIEDSRRMYCSLVERWKDGDPESAAARAGQGGAGAAQPRGRALARQA